MAYARSKGFVTINVDYPLCDPPAAMAFAAVAARMAGSTGAPVYAYGDSAGANLAIRLAEKDLVRAAAGYSPVPDWHAFVRSHPGAVVLDPLRGFTDRQLDTVSPGEYPATDPVLVLAGAKDALSPSAVLVAWGLTDPLVWTWRVDGPHLGGEPPCTAYEEHMRRAIDWLARKAGL